MYKSLIHRFLLVGTISTLLSRAPTIIMDVPTPVNLARLRELYDAKRENKDGTFSQTDWAVFQAAFHAVREEPSSFVLGTTKFHLEDPDVLLKVCADVPTPIMDLILKSLVPERSSKKIRDKIETWVHRMYKEGSYQGDQSSCHACFLVRQFLLDKWLFGDDRAAQEAADATTALLVFTAYD